MSNKALKNTIGASVVALVFAIGNYTGSQTETSEQYQTATLEACQKLDGEDRAACEFAAGAITALSRTCGVLEQGRHLTPVHASLETQYPERDRERLVTQNVDEIHEAMVASDWECTTDDCDPYADHPAWDDAVRVRVTAPDRMHRLNLMVIDNIGTLMGKAFATDCLEVQAEYEEPVAEIYAEEPVYSNRAECARAQGDKAVAEGFKRRTPEWKARKGELISEARCNQY